MSTPRVFDPNDMASRGRLGGLSKSARHDAREGTAAARETFLRRFLDEQPPDLPQTERVRRAEAARRLHFSRLARLSAKSRARRKRSASAVSC